MNPASTSDPRSALSLEGRGVDDAAPAGAAASPALAASYSCPPLEAGPLRSRPTAPLPMFAETHEHGWDEVDIVFVTGDAYVDHPALRWRCWGGCWKAKAFASALSASLIGEIVMPGGPSAGRWGGSLLSARATWTR